jgi:hypothetical protein
VNAQAIAPVESLELSAMFAADIEGMTSFSGSAGETQTQ